MGKGFNLGEYLKDGRATARVAPTEESGGVSELNTGREELRYLPLDQIDPDPANFYSLEGLDDLAGNIELVGLQQPLRVRPNGERFVVVSGHRRRAACLLIRDGGNPMFDQGVPCLVDYGEASDAMRELRLIFANSATRVMSSAEQSKQAERVTELLYQLKEQGVEFPGRMRDHVAETCNLSRSKIGRLQAIRGNLIDDFLGLYDDGKINESMAYRISQETTQTQIQIWKDQGSVIQHLTVDGISSYVAQLRFMQNCKVEPVGAAISRPQKGDGGPMRASAPTEDGKKESQKPATYTAKPWPKKYDHVEMWEREMWQRVKARREALGLSIEEVYDTYGEQNVRQFEKYENGEPCEWDPITELSLTDDERFKFADKLQCSFDYLYSRSDVPEIAEQILNNLPQAELCEAGPHWGEGDPPRDGRYYARIDMGDGGTHEAVGEYRGGSWSVFGRPLHESMKVVGWWPLPERMEEK